ncbi:PAAR domain-containing protein [Pseudomonas fluorescens]|jgi:uncharacterized Zn-binding protein involved in type VI secretion|uniref:Zn-binding Pro-Ala-Ala-Arg (PAAR) domain-containing protein, incolved in TypeVI secretion n=1 Tax=Pseudomonas fluorescens TaxID=294 RepID=A0A423PDB6_PSEFL|nr:MULTISPECIES: PAAR domain-containing protein [Pseudomonas]OOH81275.1 hypothetical protein BOW65_09340 [Pseudomonas koreensis]PIF52315.1 putative Zn-binding protein involved in type VI secretion [Pseudomonas sp. 29]ROO13804.1 hypothetical protein BK673_01645 [Pseudomonas fluorescens]WRH94116.1 PAAR domain-containing protein [Pseudomonas fluorescens]
MSGKPAARVTDPTNCPLPGHGTNPIASGSPNVNFDGLAAARMTDKSACGSPITGGVSTTVFINGLNAATKDSTGAHGNVVIGGSGTVIIGDTVVTAPFSGLMPMPVHFSDKFQLIDEDSGEPLPDHVYAFQRADGSIEHGVSDKNGYTHVVSSHLAETITLFLED